MERLGWKTIEELIAEESKTIVYKSFYGLAPQYLCHLFARNSAGETRNSAGGVIRSLTLSYQKNLPWMDKNVFPIVG